MPHARHGHREFHTNWNVEQSGRGWRAGVSQTVPMHACRLLATPWIWEQGCCGISEGEIPTGVFL